MTTQNDPTIPQDSLDRIIAAYLEGIDAGESPDRQKLLERYPQHAEQLRSFFADHDRMDRAAAPLRLARTSDSSGDAEKDGSGSLPRVRYFGDYELLEEIARGGMGIVYKAPPGFAQPDRGPQDDPGRPVRLRIRGPAVLRRSAELPPICSIRTS